MKGFVVMILLALFLTACASDQSSRGGYGTSRGTTWDCHQIASDPWATGKNPCVR